MKFKVFGIIFISFFMVMAVNSVTKYFGESMKSHVAKIIVEKTLGPDKVKNISKTELKQLLLTPEYSEKFSAVNEAVMEEYSWYPVMSLSVSGILIIGIAMFASKLTIITVRRHEKL